MIKLKNRSVRVGEQAEEGRQILWRRKLRRQEKSGNTIHNTVSWSIICVGGTAPLKHGPDEAKFRKRENETAIG